MYVTVVTFANNTNMWNSVYGVFSEPVETIKEQFSNEGRNLHAFNFSREKIQ